MAPDQASQGARPYRALDRETRPPHPWAAADRELGAPGWLAMAAPSLVAQRDQTLLRSPTTFLPQACASFARTAGGWRFACIESRSGSGAIGGGGLARSRPIDT